MARLVYACRFEVPGDHSWESIVAPAYGKWIGGRYSGSSGDPVAVDILEGTIAGSLPARHTVDVERYQSEQFATRIDWAFPGDYGLIWRNQIRIAALTGSCAVEHQVQLLSADYLVAPAPFKFGAPGVVRTICEQHSVNVGEMQFRAIVYPLDENGIDTFVG